MDSAIENYIYSQSENQQLILLKLNDFLIDFPEITPKVRYKIPFYYRKSWICYLNCIKNDGIELAFLRGNELSNLQGALRYYGRKQVMGIRYFCLEDINFDTLQDVLIEALELDEHVPYTVKKNKD